jgi:hypothetical protein
MKLSNLYPQRDRYIPNPPATVPLQGHSKVTIGGCIRAVVRDDARALKAHGAMDPTDPLSPFQEPDPRSGHAFHFVALGPDKNSARIRPQDRPACATCLSRYPALV